MKKQKENKGRWLQSFVNTPFAPLPPKIKYNKIKDSKIKIGTCFQENIKQRKEGELYISPSPLLFEMGKFAWTPAWQSWLPALWAVGTASCLSSDWLAGKTAWALIGWQNKLPGSFYISINKHLQYCHLHLLYPCSFCFLLHSKVQGSAAEVFCSTRRSKGPWLYGDGEAHTEYVQNDSFFFLYKQSWKTPVWCSVLLFRAIHRKLRFAFTFRKQPLFLVQRLKIGGCGPSSSSSSSSSLFLHGHMLGLYIHSWKAFLHHPTLRLVLTEMNEERCSGYSRSREQWGTSETNPLGTLKQIKKPASLSASATTGCWYKFWCL